MLPGRQQDIAVDLSIGHPVRVLLEAVTRRWGSGLVTQLAEPTRFDAGSPEEIATLRRAIMERDGVLASSLIEKWLPRFGLKAPPPAVELLITGVDLPNVWEDGQAIRVNFSVKNNLALPLTGFVHATFTLGMWQEFARGRWFQRSATITGLQPGNQSSGTVVLDHWLHLPAAPGDAWIDAQLWSEDPNGTVCFVWGLPGQQHDATYAAIASDAHPVERKTFAADIRPLFRPIDIDAMRNNGTYPVDLSSYTDVRSKATDIYFDVSNGAMPCDGPWPQASVDLFKAWMDQGFAP